MPQKTSVHPRTWGTRFDTLPSSPPSSPPATEADPLQDADAIKTTEAGNLDALPKNKEEKMPHDASVFVGR